MEWNAELFSLAHEGSFAPDRSFHFLRIAHLRFLRIRETHGRQGVCAVGSPVMKMRCVLLVAIGLTGCATTLRLTKPGPPEGTFGSIRTLSVSVATASGKSVGDAVVQGLALGEIPLQVSAESVVKERLIDRLQRLGYVVCPAAPCGEGAMSVTLTESEVATQITSNGLRAHSRIRVNVKVRALDGTEPYDFDFWDNRSGPVIDAPRLVQTCADHIANRFERSLLPTQQTSTLPLEDGGELSAGVNLLLAGSWSAAARYFEDLTKRSPDLAGAWYDLGVAYEAQNLWPPAFAAYEQAAMRERSRTFLDALETARNMIPPPSPTNPANAPLPE